MKYSISNIALPAMEHEEYFHVLNELGFSNLEIAPSRKWKNTWHKLNSTDVEKYRKKIESTGLKVCGLHSLFYDQQNLSMFGDKETKVQTSEFLVHISSVCRDIGGKTLIFGSPSARNRGNLSEKEAFAQAVDFLGELCVKIKTHETILCMEPLSIDQSNFLNTVDDSLNLVKAVDSPALGLQIDLRAMVASDELNPKIFSSIKKFLRHVHVNASDLGILMSEDAQQCEKLIRLLNQISYGGMFSLEQRMVDSSNILNPIKKSLNCIKQIVAKYD